MGNLEVRKGLREREGSCYVCKCDEKDVYIATVGSFVIRVCHECGKSLIEKLIANLENEQSDKK